MNPSIICVNPSILCIVLNRVKHINQCFENHGKKKKELSIEAKDPSNLYSLVH